MKLFRFVTHYLNVYLVNWITDPRTNKKYLVMEIGPKNFSESQTICTDLGGYLAEPRDELENSYLDSLTHKTFYLGLTDSAVEGDWQFVSDFTKVS